MGGGFCMADGSHPKGEHPVDEEPVGPVLEAVKAQHAAMDDPVAQQAREHDRAKAREGGIDRLHEDTQRLRVGETRELLRPVLADLRWLRDDLLSQV